MKEGMRRDGLLEEVVGVSREEGNERRDDRQVK